MISFSGKIRARLSFREMEGAQWSYSFNSRLINRVERANERDVNRRVRKFYKKWAAVTRRWRKYFVFKSARCPGLLITRATETLKRKNERLKGEREIEREGTRGGTTI